MKQQYGFAEKEYRVRKDETRRILKELRVQIAEDPEEKTTWLLVDQINSDTGQVYRSTRRLSEFEIESGQIDVVSFEITEMLEAALKHTPNWDGR